MDLDDLIKANPVQKWKDSTFSLTFDIKGSNHVLILRLDLKTAQVGISIEDMRKHLGNMIDELFIDEKALLADINLSLRSLGKEIESVALYSEYIIVALKYDDYTMAASQAILLTEILKNFEEKVAEECWKPWLNMVVLFLSGKKS